MPRFLHALGLLGIAFTTAHLHANDETALYQRVTAACFETLVDGRLAGSGWFAPEPGWGFTAAHVVKNRDTQLQVQTGKHIWNATLHAVDLEHDIALLNIETTNKPTPPGLPMARNFPPVGSEVRLHGAPVFRHRVWLPGRVAGTGPTYEFLGGEDMTIRCIHVAGFAPKGTSGGPWVNARGEIVGLQSGGMTSNKALVGISFVTPVDALAAILRSKQSAATPTLGAAAEEIVEQPADWIAKLPANQTGIVLKVIKKDGPLDQAGARDGDMILSLNGTSFSTRNAYYHALHQLDPTHPAEIILRTADGTTKPLTLTPAIQESRFQPTAP